MPNIVTHEFRDDSGGVSISMTKKDRETYSLDMQPPRVYLGEEPTPEKSIEILKAAVNAWYVLCAGVTTDKILTEMTEFHDDGYPKIMKLSVR